MSVSVLCTDAVVCWCVRMKRAKARSELLISVLWPRTPVLATQTRNITAQAHTVTPWPPYIPSGMKPGAQGTGLREEKADADLIGGYEETAHYGARGVCGTADPPRRFSTALTRRQIKNIQGVLYGFCW